MRDHRNTTGKYYNFRHTIVPYGYCISVFTYLITYTIVIVR